MKLEFKIKMLCKDWECKWYILHDLNGTVDQFNIIYKQAQEMYMYYPEKFIDFN